MYNKICSTMTSTSRKTDIKTSQEDGWHIDDQHLSAQGASTNACATAGLDVPDVSHVVNYSLGLSVPRQSAPGFRLADVQSQLFSFQRAPGGHASSKHL